MKIEFVCPKCGKEPPRDEKASTKQWDVLPTHCPKCGVGLRPKVK